MNDATPFATTPARMRQLQATDADWLLADPTLLDGEIAFSSDLKRFKVGPGQWSTVDYWGDPDAPEDGNTYALKDGLWVETAEYTNIYTGDLNNALAGGGGIRHYRLVPTITNSWPGGGVNGDFLTVLEWDSEKAIQIGYGYSDQQNSTHVMYQRVRRGVTWGAWYSNVAYTPDLYVNDLNVLSSQGRYAIQVPVGAGVVNGWSGIGFGDVIYHTNIDSVTAIQVGFGITGGQPELWMRTKEADVWSAWVENKAGFQVTESEITDLNRIRWRNGWQPAIEYVKNDMVVSSGYLAVANTTTTDNPVPASSGDPVYALPTTPVWATTSHTGVVRSGQRAATEHRGAHAEVAAVLLHHHVSRDLRGAK